MLVQAENGSNVSTTTTRTGKKISLNRSTSTPTFTLNVKVENVKLTMDIPPSEHCSPQLKDIAHPPMSSSD